MTAEVWETCYDKWQTEMNLGKLQGKGREATHEAIWSLDPAKEQLIFTYNVLCHGCKQRLFRQ
jgi:hypothetical protein